MMRKRMRVMVWMRPMMKLSHVRPFYDWQNVDPFRNILPKVIKQEQRYCGDSQH